MRNAGEVNSRLVSYPPQALTEVPVSLDHEIQGSVGGALTISFKATFADGSARLLPVIQSAGGPVVDWDCYARHCSAPWQEILSGKPVEAEVRVFLTPDDYYNFDFADESVWKCFLLRSADLEDPIRAYTRIGSEAERSLSDPPEGEMRATLRIKLSPGQSAHHQCEILELVTHGWVKK